jgi:Rad3-related DNA helicase
MVWSLYLKKEDNSGIGAGLFEYTGEKLEPLKFSNGKTQEDVVNEVMDAIDSGHKIIFIKGVCGSGKSAMALNIAKNFKKSSIIVPIKSLQEQYEIDYTKKMFITKDDGTPLKISVIKGRNNFSCTFGGDRADDPTIPCTIEIRDKNTEALLEYIEKNPGSDREDFSSATDVKRMNVAPACPYWAPIMPSEINPKGLGEFTKKKYDAIAGVEYAIFKRKKGCPFYDQYDAYADSDVLIFNSMKYLIEIEIGRKPKTDIEIIDECDEFLDNFANEKKININRLQQAMVKLTPFEQKDRTALKEILNDVNSFLFNQEKIEIQKLASSKLYSLLEKILKAPNLASDEELNYYNTVVDIARSFEKLLDETYIATDTYSANGTKFVSGQQGLFVNKDDYEEPVIINLVSINLASKLHKLIDVNKVLVMMSGTLHSEEVLRDIFGLEKFITIEAETQNPGEIKKQRTGLERNCSYANFQNETITRKMYLKIMDLCLANAKTPTLVHVNAFKDLPTEEENNEFKFDNLITQERLRELQKFGNSAVDEFTNKESDVLFTTKCSRGIDFAGDKCNSIIVTRFPYPNVQGLFWKILKQEQPDKFMEFYLDKARRDLVQKIARGVRFNGDSVDLWSPDVRVLNGKF